MLFKIQHLLLGFMLIRLYEIRPFGVILLVEDIPSQKIVTNFLLAPSHNEKNSKNALTQ